MLLQQINVDASKLLPFQRKQLEIQLKNYYTILTDTNTVLMEISNNFFKMKKNQNLPVSDVFVKIFDNLHKNIMIIKISSNTTFDKILAILTDKVKYDPTTQLSLTIMKIYPLTPDFYDLAIYKVVQKKISHINVFVS